MRNLLRVADRDLGDARVEAVSVDTRFRLGYQAAFALATIVLAASGVRTTGVRHHVVTWQALPELLGAEFQDLTGYFDQVRSKRNVADYDRAFEIAEVELRELIEEVRKFRPVVLAWLKKHHRSLQP